MTPVILLLPIAFSYSITLYLMMFRLAPLLIAFALPALLTMGKDTSIDYNKDILPILSQNCFECHGPDENTREADRRLDTPQGAYADLEGIVAVVPGDPEASEMVYLINSEYSEERMPPVDSKKKLSQPEKDLLQDWIKQGANYDLHWAFETPQKQELPIAEHPIDAFVHDRLKAEGIEPSPLAEPATLLRRLHLDLVGLPPSPEEIKSFLANFRRSSARAVDSVIDALMERPEFGEKWARHWLDIARYADTNGFEKDKMRDQWIYREWVINALNDDMPYDQFLIEQLAGDLLPDATQDQIIATGFLRNGMVNEEGAIIPEEFRIKGIFDRMDCFGKAALGLTLQCAQCHSHKYDPISHEEYFGLFSFFNDTHEAQSWVYSDSQLAKIEEIKRKVAELETRIKTDFPNWEYELASWASEQQAIDSKWKIWDTRLQNWEGGLNHPEELSDHSILIQGHPSVTGVTLIEGESSLPMVTGMRLEALTHGDQPFRGPGRSYWGTFAISEWEVYRKWPGDKDWTKVESNEAWADFNPEIGPLKDYFHHKTKDPEKKRRIGPAKFLVDDNEKTAWSPDRGPILRHTESVASIRFKEPLAMPKGSEIRVRLIQNHGGSLNGRDNQQLGRLRLSLTDSTDLRLPSCDHEATLALQKTENSRTSEESAAIFRAWRKSSEKLCEINEQIAQLESRYPEGKTSVLHTLDTSSELKRVTHLLEKGAWNQPKQVVERRTPAILNPLDKANPTRLDLARWVTNDDAPLTARVHVNRIWQALFGEGLVTTPEDFGTRAATPEYQNALDWLAVDFLENGWSQKSLIRSIVSSNTYQQSSHNRPDLQEKDPRNRLLARGPRFRADAEVVRDIALATSGLLNYKIGGPSIFPPIPETVINDNYFIPEYWKETTDDNRYRRSLYLFRKRAMPDPALASFDAPNADIACVQRVRTNSPLSALTSLNEPIFVESAKALALRILKEGGNNHESRVNYGYLLTTGRPARNFEVKELVQLIKEQDERLADGWLDTQEIAFIDTEKPPQLPDNVTPRELASWAIAARVLLNLDETLTKN